MNFEIALVALREGKKIIRPCMRIKFPDCYLILTEYGIMLYDPATHNKYEAEYAKEMKYTQLSDIDMNHILADDWEIIE